MTFKFFPFRINGRSPFRYLTGGRPMTKIGPAFVDMVSGKQVYYFKDDIGLHWLAEHAWSLFRLAR